MSALSDLAHKPRTPPRSIPEPEEGMQPGLSWWLTNEISAHPDDEEEWQAKIQRLEDACHPYQREYVLDESRWIVALTGGRCGKTTGMRVRLLRRAMLTDRARCLFIAETRPHAEELFWLPLKDMVEELGIDCKFDETRLVCTLKRNGSQIKLVGADDKREINKLRGVPRHEVGIDEGASHPSELLEQLIDRVLAPRLGDYSGTLCLVGTPGHILDGLFYEATRPGSTISRPYRDRENPDYEGWEGWSFHSWSMREAAEHVPNIANAWRNALTKKRLEGWGDDHPVWMREYLGLWAADDAENVFKYRPHTQEGACFNRYEPKLDPRTQVAILPDGDWVYTYGLDMGHSDPFALVVLAHNPATNELRHIYEFEQAGLFPRDVAKLLVGEEWCAAVNAGREPPDEPGGILGVTSWPLGMRADMTHLGGAIIGELVEVYGIPIEKAEQRNKHDAIEIVNGDLQDQRLYIMGGSKLEKQMANLQWDVDPTGRFRENKRQANHLCDALIYARQAAKHLRGEPAPEEPRRRIPGKRPQIVPIDSGAEDFGFDLADADFGGFDEYE